MPSDERGIYIKVYPDELRKLIQASQLTHSEIGALLMVALRINASNRCYPSNAKLAQDVGKTDRCTVSRIHQHLRAKGALDWTQDPDKRTNVYLVPLCFSFGSEVYQNSITSDAKTQHTDAKMHQGGDAKMHQGGDAKMHQGGDAKMHHKVDTDEEDSIFKNRQTEQQAADSPSGWPLNKEDQRFDQLLTMRSLMDAGVDDREAYLIVQQYDARTIQHTLKLSKDKDIENPGGWIRSVIERQTGKKLKYPGQTAQNHSKNGNRGESEQFHKEFTAAASAARLVSPYQRDYDRYAPKEDEEIS